MEASDQKIKQLKNTLEQLLKKCEHWMEKIKTRLEQEELDKAEKKHLKQTLRKFQEAHSIITKKLDKKIKNS